MKEQSKGEDYFISVVGLRQLSDDVVKFEELSDGLRIFDAVKDGDD
jgi:hypothetical protein